MTHLATPQSRHTVCRVSPSPRSALVYPNITVKSRTRQTETDRDRQRQTETEKPTEQGAEQPSPLANAIISSAPSPSPHTHTRPQNKNHLTQRAHSSHWRTERVRPVGDTLRESQLPPAVAILSAPPRSPPPPAAGRYRNTGV